MNKRFANAHTHLGRKPMLYALTTETLVCSVSTKIPATRTFTVMSDWQYNLTCVA
jgi:hypothetical protein